MLLRSNERSIDLINPVYDSKNNLVSGTLNDAWVRTEHYKRQSETEFYQLGGSWDQDVTDTFRFTVLGGFSKSGLQAPRCAHWPFGTVACSSPFGPTRSLS